MTDNKIKQIQNLQRAIHIFGPDAYDTKIAAIQCCHAYGLDPYYRYAVWLKISPTVEDDPDPLAIESVEEWQRMIHRVISHGR